MDQVKMVLVDIDGTLLNDEGKVTPKTIDAISKLKDKNIIFGIATGRTPFAVKHLIKDWKIDKYVDIIMGFNGGCYFNMHTNESKSHYLLDGKCIKDILDDFKEFNFNAGIYDQESFHVLKEDGHVNNIAAKNKLPLIIDDLNQYQTSQIEKVLLIADKDEIDRMEQYYKSLSKLNYRAVRSSSILFECLNPELSKSKGIKKMCQDLNIDTNNIITFGDELNDYEMIRDYIGVAMANANEEIKKVAKYVTTSNNDDGISEFLIKHGVI